MNKMKSNMAIKVHFLLLSLFCFFAFSDDVLALIKITSIEVKDDTVKIDGTDNLINYKIDKADPFSIAIEIDNAELSKPQDKPFKSNGIINELRAVQVSPDNKNKKTKILISLNTPADIDTKNSGNSLYIKVAKGISLSTKDTYPLTETQKVTIKESAVKEILESPIANEVIAVFMDKIDNGAELVIKGNGSMPDPVVYNLDQLTIVEIENMQMKSFIPSTLINPFRKISYKEERKTLKFFISVETNEILSYAKKGSDIDIDVKVSNDEIIITAKALKIDYEEQKVDKDSISLNYINSNVKSILRSISDKINYNLIIGEDVPDATVTIKQDNIHWKDAI
ncbi:MAG TPA: hypothetical protein HPP56_07155, partial [Nitrospirae bacterium]|nr:hypothetical protein [Nitrospirota bacterium]